LEEAAEACHIQHVAQKARRIAKAKEREKAEKRRIVEEKKKRLEYIQQLQNKILVEDATLLEGTGSFQIVRTKYRENISENEEN